MRFLFASSIAASVSRQKFARLSRSTMHWQGRGRASFGNARKRTCPASRATSGYHKAIKLPGRKNREGSCRVLKQFARWSPLSCGPEILELQKISTKGEESKM